MKKMETNDILSIVILILIVLLVIFHKNTISRRTDWQAKN